MASDPLRVLIVIGQLGRGGAERQVHELATRLDRARFLPLVVTFEAGGHYQAMLESAGVEVEVLDKSGWREATLVSRLASLMSRRAIAVIHAFLFPANWRAVAAAALAGRRGVICSVRSTGVWMNPRHRLMDRLALRRAAVVVANAPAVREDVIRRVGVEPGRVEVIMNGVDSLTFAPGGSTLRSGWGGSDIAPLVGFVGSLREAKDPVLFLRIAALVAGRAPRTRFVIVGDGPLRPRLEAIAREGELRDRVVFAGERSDMPDVLRALDVLAVTSVREGCCNVILEAMATGTPVVATAVGGNPDLIAHGATGRLFPHGDAQAGADAVSALLPGQEEARRLREGGLSRARGAFSLGAMVLATSDLYERVA